MRESDTTTPFFTVGHSDRSLEAFVGLLRVAQVELVVDVRKIPRSGSNPQFDAETLSDGLEPFGVSYEHSARLGGLRGRARNTPLDVNGLWTNRSFHNYADYALSPEFQAGLDHLLNEGDDRRCAIMCSEAVWWRCHRRIIADYLIANKRDVLHIMEGGRLQPARLTPGAVARSDGSVVYPASNQPAPE